MNLETTIAALAREAREAAQVLAGCSSSTKNTVLRRMAILLEEQREHLQAANMLDLKQAEAADMSAAMLDRLRLKDPVIQSMVTGLREVAALPDPVGSSGPAQIRPNGLEVSRMRIPLGVIGIIYESRPNVTIDAAALCLKAGNAVILRGGSEAFESNQALVGIIQQALRENNLPDAVVQFLPTRAREAISILLEQEDTIDVIIPRGGESLIRFVTAHSRIPVLKHYKGVCHVYVDEDADLTMAEEIAFNAKVQRPGVCNAMETLLVHAAAAPSLLPGLAEQLLAADVELRGCPHTCRIVPEAIAAVESDWPAEFLDLILAIRIVDTMDEAMAHIRQYGSQHTEAIITRNYARARRFVREVDASVVLINASTRFNDGGQLGLGAEIGISTSKLHAFGPMGLEELTTTKFVVAGNGQIRS